MATYVIGDLQGCLQPLKYLLEKINFRSGKDHIIFAGDIVNRGPESLETLRFVKYLGANATVILGNHDLFLLGCFYGDLTPGPTDTIRPILQADDASELITWLAHQKLYVRYHNHSITHAGIPPIWSAKKTRRLAQSLERVLRQQPTTFLKHLFGNHPDQWNNRLKGIDRWRCIANYLTRMRLCDQNGRLELQDRLGKQNKGHFAPWFSYPNPKKNAKETFIFGHWAALEGQTHLTDIIALDTGCVWGNCLTAYCIESQQFYQVDCHE